MPSDTSQSTNDDAVPCSHTDCDLPLFDAHYKSRLRREFRALSLEQRQLALSTTTLRLCTFPDGDCQFPFVIDCFLPWNGSLLSVCHEFYCHCLKISQRMLEAHHETAWNDSKTVAFPASAYSAKPSKKGDAYSRNLSKAIESFNVLPKAVDASNYTPRGSANSSTTAKRYSSKRQKRPKLKAGAFPKLKPATSTNSNSNSKTAKQKKSSKPIKSNEKSDDGGEEPKLLLGLLRIAAPNSNSKERTEPIAKTSKSKNESNSKVQNSKEDLLQPLNRFLSRVRCIAARVDDIATDFHRSEMAEAESMRDHLFLGRVLSEADVDPSAGDSVDGAAHWKRVQRMFSVMDAKEAEHRGKHHIQTAIKNMKARHLRELLSTVKASLAAMHRSVDGIKEITEIEPEEREREEPLSEFDHFISPALRSRNVEAFEGRSKASMLIGNKKGILKSLDKVAALQKSMKSMKSLTNSNMNSQPGNPADHLRATEVILQTPESMKERNSAERRTSLNNALSLKNKGVHFDVAVETKNVDVDPFVEDMLLSTIEDLRAESDEWKAKYLSLTADHRRMSVRHAKQGMIARALKTKMMRQPMSPMSRQRSAASASHEFESVSEDVHELQSISVAAISMDAAVQTETHREVDDAETKHPTDEFEQKARHKSILEAVAHVDRAPL